MLRRRPESLAAMVLLQVDIEGHTPWMASNPSKPSAAADRIEIAELFLKALNNHGFKILSWKGDGGVYSAPTSQGAGSLDFSVKAAEAAAKTFAKWRAGRRNRKSLRVRISVHWAPDVYEHRVSGYWSSDHLNLFIKFERQIGLSGTVAVTKPAYRNLTEKTQQRFKWSRSRPLGNRPGQDLIESVYYLPLEGETSVNSSGVGGFFEWISGTAVSVAENALGPTAYRRVSVGDSSFLFVAPLPDSPLTIDLNRVEEDLPELLTKDEAVEWNRRTEEALENCRKQLRADDEKVSPVRIVRPISDVPFVAVDWRVQQWSRARAFHRLLEDRSPLWRRLAPKALAVQEEGLNFPGITCCHVVVRTAEADKPAVLLCQRQIKGQSGTYHPGRWSISFEEQLNAGESVPACIERGLREELLGEEGSASATYRVLAAVIEREILNLTFIVLVDLPMSLDQIVLRWQQAIDKDEHRQLALVALNREILGPLSGGELSALRDEIRPSHPDLFRENTDWKLHPTSLARYSVALWAQETGH